MSTDPDKATGCPIESDKSVNTELAECGDNFSELSDECKGKKKIPRSVRFPDEDLIVTQYFEPANPWQDVPPTTKSQVAAEYLEACRRHNTPCIDSVLQQIRELPDSSIGGAARAPRLTLAECSLSGPAPADALEAVMRKVQFRRVEIEHATIDDEGAEALFDMIEYYESATVLSIAGPRQFGIRGWQAASRMIKKSADLSELEVSDAPLEASHAPVLARSLRAHTCTLRALCLQRVSLCGEPLLCLVIALKSNSSIRELRLCDNRLSVSDASQLASLLKYNSRIQLLDLSNNLIQDAGTAHLADALAEQASQSPPSAAASPLSPHRCQVGGHEARGLAFLVLWNNQLTRNCAPYLSKALRSSQSLCVLNIGRNALGNDAVRALARGSALVSLGLQASRLGPDAAALAELIRADTKLQRLDLRENRLGSAGLQAILAAMKDNSTLTQIDLDEPPAPDSTNLTAEDSETALIRRLTREIRAACRRNEPPVRHDEEGTHPVHRKISLTCHTACLLRQGMGGGEEERRSRLRSPAPSPAPSPGPSPAGSPVPAPHPTSRFMVTRVTPERDSSTDSSGSTSSSSSTPTRLAYCPPSRFRVVQVMEPPQIQVHPASSQARKSPSRFSVTRNYDSVYNPNPTPPNSPAQPVLYTQLQNEVVTQLKYEANLNKNDVLTQTKNEVVTQLRHENAVKCGSLTNEAIAQLGNEKSETQQKNEVHTQVKNEITAAKTEPTRGDVENVGPLEKESTGKKVITTQVRNEAMKQSKNESVRQVQNESSVQMKNEGTVETEIKLDSKIDPRTENRSQLSIDLTKNNVTTQLKHDLSHEKPVVQVKKESEVELQNIPVRSDTNESKTEPQTTVKNIVTTQSQKEPALDKVEFKIPVKNQGSQVSSNIAATSLTDTNKQAKYSSIESAILDKITLGTQLEMESTSQIRNPTVVSSILNIVPFTQHINKDTVSKSSTESVVQFVKPLVESTSQTNFDDKQSKSPSVETVIQVKNGSTQPIAELTTQLRQLAVEPPSQKVDPASHKVDPKIHKVEPTSHMVEPTSHKVEPAIHKVDPTSHKVEPTSHMVDPTIHMVEPTVRKVEPTSHNVEPTSHKVEPTTHKVEPTTHKFEPAIHKVEPTIHKVEPTSSKLEAVIQARNQTVTQFSTGAKAQSEDIMVESTSQTITADKQSKSSTVEPIQHKDSETQLEVDLAVQFKNLSVVSTSLADIGIKQAGTPTVEPVIKAKDVSASSVRIELKSQTQTASEVSTNRLQTEPVSLLQIVTADTIVKSVLPLSAESSSNEHTDLDSATQLRGLIETSSKIKTSPSHSILPKTSIATIEEFPECDEVELSDSTASSITQLSTDNATSDSSKTKSIVECDPASKSNTIVERVTGELKTIVDPKNTLENHFKDSNIVTEVGDTPRTSAELSTQAVPQSDSHIKSDISNLPKNISDTNVIEISIKPSVVTSELKYSDVVKTDRKNTSKVLPDQKDAMNNIVEDLGNIIKEIKVLVKNKNSLDDHVPADSIILKKNKSESSLDSPDLEVSRLMENRREERSVFDSNSSLEISGSSMESLNEQNKTVQELDRRKTSILLSNEGSMESTSEVTPVNSGNFLNLSLSSNESVSPIFGKTKLIHDSLSSLEASVSSLDSAKQDRIMVTSADSGIEYSLQHPSENKEDNSSNEGTLTNNSSLKETVKKPESFQLVDTLSSPKRTSSLLDVPALKNKGLDRMRKISWVAPSSSFHIPRPDEKETKPSHLEKLLSLFQHPSSIFSRSLTSDDEKKSASNTPPRKDSSLSSSFWSWGSTIEKEREEDSSEATDSTLSERVQVSFVDESFSRKLDSKTPSTDTDNTLSEFQSFPTQESETTDDRVTKTTEDLIVQNLDLSVISNTKKDLDRNDDLLREGQEEKEKEFVRPRSFAAVLKSSGSENSLDKQNSPDNGQPVDKLPSKVIRGIKENISPENTLTSSMTNTKALAVELERQVKNPTLNVWDVKNEPKIEEVKVQSDLAPIATIEETLDEDNPLQLAYIDDVKVEDATRVHLDEEKKTQDIDLGKDALSYLIYENRDFEIGAESMVKTTAQQGSLAQELKEAEIKEILDLSPELVVDDSLQDNVFTAKEIIGLRTSPIIPERAKLKKANSLEDLSQLSDEKSPKAKTIAFKVPESTTPRDIPERRSKLRTRSGSSPKSLPESLNKPCPLTKMESILTKKKKKVSSLGKMARDSLLALNMSEEEIAEFRRSYKLTSVESLKSLESVSESGNSVDSRCRACLRQSQESLMSLDSISEDCKCIDECDRPSKSTR